MLSIYLSLCVMSIDLSFFFFFFQFKLVSVDIQFSPFGYPF